MVPPAIGTKTDFARPAVPVGLGIIVGGAAKQKTDASRFSDTAQPQRIVLVVLLIGKVRTSFANEVDVLTGVDLIDADPRFEGDRLAQIKIETSIIVVGNA